ncbi:MAG: hypothetical protein H6645_05440 [Caldilineaceae bacterium]|nr:hypothetical protein [Caldilineaceae bacterium]
MPSISAQIESVLGKMMLYVALSGAADRSRRAYTHCALGRDETFVGTLGDLALLFIVGRWTHSGWMGLSLYPDLAERIWDPENRIEHIVARQFLAPRIL